MLFSWTGGAVKLKHIDIRNPVVTRAAENNARTGSSGLSAPFCSLAFLLSAYQSGRWLVGAVGIDTQSSSTAPEHRRAALLPRVCQGQGQGHATPVRDVHRGGSAGVRERLLAAAQGLIVFLPVGPPLGQGKTRKGIWGPVGKAFEVTQRRLFFAG